MGMRLDGPHWHDSPDWRDLREGSKGGNGHKNHDVAGKQHLGIMEVLPL